MPPSPRPATRSRWRTPCGSPSRPGAPRSWRDACPSARWRYPRRPSKGCWIKDATAARRAALHLLAAVRTGATFGVARDRALVGLADRDGRLAYERAAGVLRRQAALDRTLDLSRADPRLHDILRLGTYQLTALSRVPPYAAVPTTVPLPPQTPPHA